VIREDSIRAENREYFGPRQDSRPMRLFRVPSGLGPPRGLHDHPEWGEDRIAEELVMKLGVTHSTSTIRRYMVRSPSSPTRP
jgi:hypothetical protein